mmetsp:Transcript_24597/g.79494  ORF Transcript_24597/g.79494 Transcript_24597/m.79494 type:complete len:394 (-) Transcript_24597:337-1518(-)
MGSLPTWSVAILAKAGHPFIPVVSPFGKHRGMPTTFTNTLRASSGGIFAFACKAAVIPAVASVFLKQAQLSDWGGCSEVLSEFSSVHPQVWGGFNGLLSFMVVFRTSFAYGRWDKGSDRLMELEGCHVDAASSLMAFTQGSSAPPEEVETYLRKIAILISWMQAEALLTLRGDDLQKRTLKLLHVLSLDELDAKSRQILARSCRKQGKGSFLISHWIQRQVMDGMSKNIIVAQPAMVGRVIAELSRGFIACERAKQFTVVPFPVPLEKTVLTLLIINGFLIPIASLAWSGRILVIFCYSFLLLFINGSLYQIAVAMEEPFGDDSCDLDIVATQDRLNMRLLLLLSAEAQHLPTTVLHPASKGPSDPPELVLVEASWMAEDDNDLDDSTTNLTG